MFLRNFLAAIMVSFFLQPVYASVSIYINEPITRGVSQEDAASVAELVRVSTGQVSGFNLALKKENANLVLQLRILKIGQSYIVALEKLKDNEVSYSSSLKASTLDEMDTVVSRLTQSVLQEAPVDSNARVNNLTQTESRKNEVRKETERYWYFGLGGFGLRNLEANKVNYNLSIGYVWDMHWYASAKLFWDGTFSTGSNKASFNDFGIGGYYFFRDTDITPLATVDFGFGSSTKSASVTPTEDTDGFVLGLGTGLRLFRLSKTNIELLLRYAVLLKENSQGMPASVGARMSLYF